MTAAITERASRPRVSDMLYILATSGGVPLAGNMTAWPKDVRRLDGWLLFPIERHWQTGEVERSEARARASSCRKVCCCWSGGIIASG